MAQHDYVIANGTGAAVRSDLNNALAAIVSQNSGPVAPTTTYAYMPWADTGSSPPVFKIRNAANNGWITLYELDGTFSIEAGSASSPGLYFTGDTNTGIYSPGADQFGISTGGTSRLVIDASGNINMDSGTVYVDAANNRLGIGTTSPSYPLSVKSATDGGQAIFDLNNEDAGNYGGLRVHLGNTDRECRLEATYNSSFFTFYTSGSSGSGTERARIDSSGRLLVGTSSAPADSTVLFSGNAGDGATGDARLYLNRGSDPGTNVQLGALHFSANNGANRGASVLAVRDGGTWTAGSSHPSRLVFSTTADGASSPTERCRISQNGYFKASTNGTYLGTDTHTIYQSNTNQYGMIVGGMGSYTSTVLGLQGTNATSTAFNLIQGFFGGNQATGLGASLCFQVRGDGNVTNTNNSYGAISDIKLKENIVDASSQWSDIKALQVRKYNFKEGQTHTQIGLVAQEVELVSPGLVSESPDRDEEGNDLGTVTKSVNYSVLYMKAVKALQEAMGRIETLEAKVAALEAS